LKENEGNISEEDEHFLTLVQQTKSMLPSLKSLMQTKGKINMVFSAQLTEEFTARAEKIKQAYMIETLKKVDQLKEAISLKKTIILQALSGLHHIQFEPERGIVLDQLSSMIDDGSSLMTDRSLTMDKMY